MWGWSKLYLKLLLFVVLIGCVACGGGNSDEEKPDDPGNTPDAVLAYTKDGGHARTLSTDDVSRYKMVQETLDTLGTDEDAFNGELDLYIESLLSDVESADTIPSFAPRGGSKSLIVDVENGKIDYSGFVLIGDIDFDSQVSFADVNLLKEALFLESSSSVYDVNRDTIVDLLDLIFVLSRLGTEVVTFDFYTTGGEKLDITTRAVSESSVFDYDGPEIQVMVVPKDINHVSGFESGLSDINDVWYKKTGWVYENSEIAPKTKSKAFSGNLLKGALDKVVDMTYVSANPHLIGWHLSLKYVEVGSFAELDELGLEGLEFYFKPYDEKIVSLFSKANMGHPATRYLDKVKFFLHIGATGKVTHVLADNVTVKNSFINDGERIYINQIVHAASVIFTSEEDKQLSGIVEKDNGTVEGKIKLHRKGPEPEEKDFEADVNDGEFSFDSLPYGEYTAEFESKCGCPDSLGSDFVFVNETELTFNLSSKEVDIALTITDKDDNPQKNKAVIITPKDCMEESTTYTSTTDQSGAVSFEDVAPGLYDVTVEGKTAGTITVCEDYTGVIKIEDTTLWRFHVTYSSSFLGSGTMTIEKFPVMLEDRTNGYYVFVGNDYRTYPEEPTISYTGALKYDSLLSPLLVYDSDYPIVGGIAVGFNALIPTDVQDYQVGSGVLPSAETCTGFLPAGALDKFKNGEKIQWTSSDPAGVPICTFTFEPYTAE